MSIKEPNDKQSDILAKYETAMRDFQKLELELASLKTNLSTLEQELGETIPQDGTIVVSNDLQAEWEPETERRFDYERFKQRLSNHQTLCKNGKLVLDILDLCSPRKPTKWHDFGIDLDNYYYKLKAEEFRLVVKEKTC